MSAEHLVFVYGTLRRGFRNHHLIADARFEAATTTAEPMVMISLGPYPGVLTNDATGPATHIVGELYRMDDTLLARCDRLEDHPDYYRRDITPLANGREAWMYRLPAAWFPHHPRIPTGDWADAA